MIIDTHQHFGTSMFSGVTTTEAELLAAMDANGIDLAFVMPQPTLEDVRPIHDQIAESAEKHPQRIRGMASISPWLSESEYFAEARRCVNQLGFVALKHHPLGHNIAPNAGPSDKVFQAADELGVPVIVHTGLGTPWSLPSLCIPPARKYPNVPVIAAHAGWGVYSAEAIVAAQVCDNIYLEPSWCPTYVARKMIDEFGAERVLWGSDHLSNMPVELAKYRAIGLTEAQLDEVMRGTAERIFPLSR